MTNRKLNLSLVGHGRRIADSLWMVKLRGALDFPFLEVKRREKRDHHAYIVLYGRFALASICVVPYTFLGFLHRVLEHIYDDDFDGTSYCTCGRTKLKHHFTKHYIEIYVTQYCEYYKMDWADQ